MLIRLAKEGFWTFFMTELAGPKLTSPKRSSPWASEQHFSELVASIFPPASVDNNLVTQQCSASPVFTCTKWV